MKKYLFLLLAVLLFSYCKIDCSERTAYHPDCGCPPGQSTLDDDCFYSTGKVLYYGLANFYCIPDSIAIGIDTVGKQVTAYITENVGVSISGLSSYNSGDKAITSRSCDVSGTQAVTLAQFNDNSFSSLPSELVIDLYLKPSIHYEAPVLDSTQIVVKRR
ncbi:MAG: hypothetical protein IPL33_22470 [Sphingobacteriales bacterium]|nr:hypothetical protein [Sphingobacteriales bacterium]